MTILNRSFEMHIYAFCAQGINCVAHLPNFVGVYLLQIVATRKATEKRTRRMREMTGNATCHIENKIRLVTTVIPTGATT